MKDENRLNKIRGSLYGGIVGDALGAPYEFRERDSYAWSKDMKEVPHFKLDAGSYTDDGAMLLCSAYSLTECNGFDLVHMLNSFLAWFMDGFLSVNGKCFDIGNTTRRALLDWHWHLTATDNNVPHIYIDLFQRSGNGSIMRLCPIPLFYSNDPEQAQLNSIQASMLTHQSSPCLECSKFIAHCIVAFINGKSKEDVLGITYKNHLPEMFDIDNGAFKSKSRDKIKTTGYVIDTLEAALWALWNSDTFEDGMLMLIPMGGDVDTICCVYGQLAGALYGYSSIPNRWIDDLKNRSLIDTIFERFLQALEKSS